MTRRPHARPCLRLVSRHILTVLISGGLSGVLVAPALAQRYDPRLAFSSLRTDHFTIHFHPRQEALAARLSGIAEEVHARLTAEFPDTSDRHTQVILVDQSDLANGWATPLPYNTIELSVAAPTPSSTIGYTDDWLRLVFTHEYVHILHLDRSRGIFGGLRRIFGRAPALFPNVFLPGWSVEGLATYVETTATGTGRVNAGEFRLLVDAAARTGRFEPIDRASGALVDWPGGHTPYAFGSRFHEYLAGRFGPESLARLADVTAGRLPYMAGGAYRRVFGASAASLWQDFQRGVGQQDRLPPIANAPVERLTSHGFLVSGPRWRHDGSAVIYTTRDPHDFPALMESAPGRPARRLATRYLGERASVTETHVFFDQREFTSSVALRSDLYALDLRTADVQRLTRHRRASDPDVSPDQESLAAVLEGDGRSRVAIFPLARNGGPLEVGAPRVLAESSETQYAAPRWSPDGTRLAVERRKLGTRPDVVVLDASTGRLLQRISASEGRVGEPEWTREGSRLVVSWERPDRPFNLFEVDLDAAEARVLLELPYGARSAAVAPDGQRLAFLGYSTEGYDVFAAPMPPAGDAAPGLQVAASDSEPIARDLPQVQAAPYSPAGTILPRFWMPVVTTDDEQLGAGAATAGMDVLGRHLYGAAAWWSDRARPDWLLTYMYQRWRPTLFAAVSDDVSRWQEADYRETAVDVGATLAFRTVRRTQTIHGAMHATREEDPAGVFDRRAARLAYQLSTARRYGYSVSPEEGFRAGVTAEFTRRALGADADGAVLTLDARAYPRLGGRNRVLALRAAGGASWGDQAARRIFGAGGAAAAGSVTSFSRSALGLVRGFADDDVLGDRAVVFNADYRVPLLRVERGIRHWPVFLRHVHGAAFADAANAWRGRFDSGEFRASAGFELSADVVLGHYLPITVAGGVALRRDPEGRQEGAALFGRVGYAF